MVNMSPKSGWAMCPTAAGIPWRTPTAVNAATVSTPLSCRNMAMDRSSGRAGPMVPSPSTMNLLECPVEKNFLNPQRVKPHRRGLLYKRRCPCTTCDPRFPFVGHHLPGERALADRSYDPSPAVAHGAATPDVCGDERGSCCPSRHQKRRTGECDQCPSFCGVYRQLSPNGSSPSKSGTVLSIRWVFPGTLAGDGPPPARRRAPIFSPPPAGDPNTRIPRNQGLYGQCRETIRR